MNISSLSDQKCLVGKSNFKTRLLIMRYHFAPTRMVTIKETDNNKHWGGCGKLEPADIAGGNVKWCNHDGKQSGNSSEKLNTELPYDPAISLLGIYSQRNENIKLHRSLFESVHSSLIHDGQRQKQPKHPSNDEWESKMSCIHTMEIIQVKRNEVLRQAIKTLGHPMKNIRLSGS